jgi:hypothetical protein
MIDSFRRVAGCRPGSVFFLCKPQIETGYETFPVSSENIFFNYGRSDEKHWQYKEF